MGSLKESPRFSHQQVSLRQLHNFKGAFTHHYDSLEPIREQYRILHKLVKRSRTTEIGRRFGFGGWLASSEKEKKSLYELLQTLPIQTYDLFYETYLKPHLVFDDRGNPMVLDVSDLLWSGGGNVFCTTPGTTLGRKKIIPYSDDLVHQSNESAMHFISSYLIRREKSQLLKGNFFYLESSPRSRRLTNNYYVGSRFEVTTKFGTVLSRVFGFADQWVDPAQDWESGSEVLVQDLLGHKYITGLCGRTDWLDRILEQVLVKTGKSYFDDIHPAFEGIVHGGVSSFQHLESLRGKFRRPVEMLEMYPATETGTLGFQMVGEDRMRFTPYFGVFFEFEDEQGNVGPIECVTTDREYALIVTTCSGLWRYRLGDRIRFHSTDPLLIEYVVRDDPLPCAEIRIGERTCHEAIQGLQGKNWFGLRRFHVGADLRNHRHVWMFRLDRLSALRDGLGSAIDLELKERDPGYRAEREAGKWNEPLVVSFTADFWDRVTTHLAGSRPTASRLPVVLRGETIPLILNLAGIR